MSMETVKNKVINLELYRAKKLVDRYVLLGQYDAKLSATLSSSKFETVPGFETAVKCFEQSFVHEHNLIEFSLASKHLSFESKVLRRSYKPNLFIMSVWYHEMQKIMLLKTDTMYSRWIIAKFQKQYKKIDDALERDILTLTVFLKKYKTYKNTDKYISANKLLDQLTMYRLVFKEVKKVIKGF